MNSKHEFPEKTWPRWLRTSIAGQSAILALVWLATGPVQAGTNLLSNPGFESGDTYWSASILRVGSTGSVVTDAGAAHSGSNYYSTTNAGGWASVAQGDLLGGWSTGSSLPVSDAKFYKLSAWVKLPGGATTPQTLTLRYRFEPSGERNDVGRKTINTGDWTLLETGWLKPPAGTTFISYWEAHADVNGVTFHVDDCVLEETAPLTLQGRVVDGAAAGVDGATVTASSPGYVAAATTTSGGGYYTLSVPPGTYTVGATTLGFKGTASVAVSASPTTAADIVLGPDPDYDPDLVFSVRSSALSGSGPWPCAYPSGQSLARMGSPAVEPIGSQQWEKNSYASGDGFRFTSAHGTTIPCNGASLVAVVKPKRTNDSWWSSVLNCYYNALMVNVRNPDGVVQVTINGKWYDGPILADGQEAVLSAVIAADGTIKVYVNGEPSTLTAPVGSFTSITPMGWNGDGTFNGTMGFAQDINIGRNDPDGWSTYNGNIGDVYFYKVALDDTKRVALQNSLMSKYGITPWTPPTAGLKPMLKNKGTGGWRNDTWTIGTTFTTGTSPVYVSALGYVDRNLDGLNTSHEVGIWQGNTLVTSVTVPAGTGGVLSGDFRYVGLPSVVTLNPSTVYTVNAFTAGDDWPETAANPGFNTPDFDGFAVGDGVNLVGSCARDGGLGFGPPVFTWGAAGNVGASCNLIGSTVLPVLHTVTASAGTGGMIGPVGTVGVVDGASQTFLITPNLGYRILSVLVDGVNNPAAVTAGSYTFTGVTANHTIEAVFESLPPQLVTGKVTDGATGIAGASVYFKLTGPAYLSPLHTATTDMAGNYSISLPPAEWHTMTGAEGYDYSADTTFSVTNAPVSRPDTVLTANPNWDLLFAMTVDSLAAMNAGDPTGNRATVYPVGGMMNALGSPTVANVDGVKWHSNVTTEADGYRFVPPDQAGVVSAGSYQAPIPVNGVTIVAVVQPLLDNSGSGEPRGEVVDVFYNDLFLAVVHQNGWGRQQGEVMVDFRGYDQQLTSYVIPLGQKTILSLVVQPDGQAKLYANGEEKWSYASGKDYTQLVPLSWAKTIAIGRNDFDGWSTFNGNIGDVYFYKRALPDDKRQALEAALNSKFLYNPNDTDGDGLPDSWEMSMVGNLTDLTKTGDFDKDGTDDLSEYRLGLIPDDPSSMFRATIARNAAGEVTLTWPSQMGLKFDVLWTKDLSTPLNLWDNLGPVEDTDGGPTETFVDIGVSAEPVGFYVIVLKP